MKKLVLLSLISTTLFAASAMAQGIPVNPGKWEMSTTTTVSMPGMSMPPQKEATTECVEEDMLTPEHFNDDPENPCNISDVEIKGDTAKWTVACPTEMGDMGGHWEITSSGDTLAGSGSMSAEYNGQQMGFEVSWEGKRIGDCK